jgi:hypothetical protein
MNPPKVFIARSRMYRKLLEAGLEFMSDPFFGMLVAVVTKSKGFSGLPLQLDRYLHREDST